MNVKFIKLLILIICTVSLSSNLVESQTKYKAATVAFYNLENLFDTIPSAGFINGELDYQNQFYHTSIPYEERDKYGEKCEVRLTEENLKGKKCVRELILIDEFTPNGPKAWDGEKYKQKLKNLSSVLSEIGKDFTKNAPVAIGIVEVETRKVVEDLINQPALKPYNYEVVHYNSLDKRGIDCAFIYQKERLIVTETKKYELEVFNQDGNRDYTRDILRISGRMDGDPVHFLINHWPSRSGGEAASYPKRRDAAELLLSIFNEIKAEDPDAKIIAMGDFNDDPISPSIKKVMKTVGEESKVSPQDLYNPMEKLHKKGQGTLAYRDSWNLFDQFITTGTLVGDISNSYHIYKTAIYSSAYLISKEGQYKGYPNRMYGGDTYRADGYSDHFPVYTILLKKLEK